MIHRLRRGHVPAHFTGDIMKKTLTILTALACLFVLATVVPRACAQEPMHEHPDGQGPCRYWPCSA